MKRAGLMIVVLTVALIALATVKPAVADVPAGDVILSTEYLSIETDQGRRLSFPISVKNRTEEWQEIELQVEGPEGWEVGLKDRGYFIHKLLLEPEDSQTLDFEAKPPENAEPKTYTFVIRAYGSDGMPISELKLDVTLRKEEKVRKGLTMSTKYPKLRGQAGNTFSFKLDLKNDSDEDREVSLSADAPRGWEVVFKPAFESKQVSSIRMKSDASQGIDVEITPPQRTEAGEYSVVVRAEAGGDRVEVPLSVIVVGKRRIELTTATGLLNTRATVDKDTTLDLVVGNTGSAPLENVRFSASTPVDWEVTFDPEEIPELPVGEEREVKAIIRPSPKALAGDYMLTLRATASEASDSAEVRVTVETPTAWGWIAVGAIVLVLGGLGVLFAKLSRR